MPQTVMRASARGQLPAGVTMEPEMNDRQAFGDLAVAVLLALPLATLARPHTTAHQTVADQPALKVSTADPSPGNGRVSLLG